MVGDSLRFISGGKTLANTLILSMLPYHENGPLGTGKDKLLIVSLGAGLSLFDQKSLKPIMPEVIALLEREIYRAVMCPAADTLYAMASLRHGVAIVDKTGKIIKHINKSTGLNSNKVHSIYFDRENAMWLAWKMVLPG